MIRGIATLALLFFLNLALAEDRIVISTTEREVGDLMHPSSALELLLSQALLGTVVSEGATVAQVVDKSIQIRPILGWLCSDRTMITVQDLKHSIASCIPESLGVVKMNRPSVLTVSSSTAVPKDILLALKSCPLMKYWALEAFGSDSGKQFRVVGCGAFDITSFRNGREIMLQRRMPKPGFIDQIQIKLGQLEDLTLIQTGAVQVMLNPPKTEIPEPLHLLKCPKSSFLLRPSVDAGCIQTLDIANLRWKES